ncbi:arginine-tRNA-protein transferase [Dioszegia hungarica]|uniref:Arginyl-tRNA--protein transferase 1 n=1 Tax=Dioszegia hungarica TaxID=4972 RepID=A0AA38H9I0_9TREE|nr:arginine-tRNA-protein transferase [Dioszegia hungarica]KAI9636382.1 arginine-tRNA-protein transferase [Dioszegia hungarica]
MSQPTLISPYGYDASTCGYCTPSGSRSAKATSRKYAFEGSQMSVKFYQDIINRGWRRSGDFVYHPDMARSCCPQYTIRLDAREFAPNKKHRQVLNRWNRYLSTGSREVDASSTDNKGKGKGKKKVEGEGWWTELHRYEVDIGEEGVVRFETELVPAVATPESFELYKSYQISVHQDKPEKLNMRGFRRFLCDSPLIEQPITYTKDADTEGLPANYGSYHLLYKINGQTIGISVIDILPNCVSSVYFIWDPDWAWASLGKLSGMYEASLARRIWAAGGGGGYVYMGYWIANCQKMRYKSDYSPSFLLDPGTNVFHPLNPTVDNYLQHHPYRPFLDIPTEEPPPKSTSTSDVASATAKDADMDDDEDSEEEDEDPSEPSMLFFPSPPPPGFANLSGISEGMMDRTLVLYGGARGSLVELKDLQFRNATRVKQTIRELYAALGPELIAVAGEGLAGIKDRGVLTFG